MENEQTQDMFENMQHIFDRLRNAETCGSKDENLLKDAVNVIEQLKQHNAELKQEFDLSVERLNERIKYLEEHIQERNRRDNADYVYAVRLHDRETEDDPSLATVMYTSSGIEGPWHDMATGHPDWCWDICDALMFQMDAKMEQKEKELQRLKQELGRL
jgi:chromosome segregation ATPase